jgi:hypothetical protein
MVTVSPKVSGVTSEERGSRGLSYSIGWSEEGQPVQLPVRVGACAARSVATVTFVLSATQGGRQDLPSIRVVHYA